MPLTDLYSAQEVGVIALQCPESGLLHVQSEHLLVEVLDEQGQPCREGEIGQVVVTDLHNFAMPLIRYALRDWAEVGPPCSCGRGLTTLRRVVGRTRNMAVSPAGKHFWPVLETQRMLEVLPHLRQYQFEQTAIDAITVTLACTPAPTVEKLLRLQTVLEQALGHAYRSCLSMDMAIPGNTHSVWCQWEVRGVRVSDCRAWRGRLAHLVVQISNGADMISTEVKKEGLWICEFPGFAGAGAYSRVGR